LFAFGFGLLIPSLLFAIFGSAIMKFATHYGNVMNVAEYVVNSILILAGIYLIITLKSFGKMDALVGAVMLIFLFILLLSSLRSNGLKGLLHISTILLIIGLLLIIVAVYYYCNSHIQNQVSHELAQCSLEIMKCQTCNKCISIFSIGAIAGVFGIIFENVFHKRKKAFKK
jgi:thiol:disulfide interchange protein